MAASLLRQSSRQLPRSAGRSALLLSSRPVLRLSATSRGPAAACLSQRSRSYSSQAPPPSNPPNGKRGKEKDGGKQPKEPERTSKSRNAEGAAKESLSGGAGSQEPTPDPRRDGAAEASSHGGDESGQLPPLPQGWVRLSEEELRLFEEIFESVPKSQQAFARETLDRVRKMGAPQEVRDLVAKAKHGGGLTIVDAARVLRTMHVLAKRMADMDAGRMFDQNKVPPGAEGREGAAGAEGEKEAGGTQQQQQQQQQQQSGSSGDGKGEQTPKRRDFSDMLTWIVAAMVLYPLSGMIFPSQSSREITWQELRKNFLDKGLVEKLVVLGNRVRVELNRQETQAMYPDTIAANANFYYYFSIGSVEAFEKRLEEAQAELGIPPSERIPVSYAKEGMLGNLVMAFGPTILLVGLLMWSMRRVGGGAGGASGVFGFGKSKAKMFNHDTVVKVRFADVAGMDEAKLEIMEFVSFLRAPEKFQRLGAKIPRGAILSGPPGTGKTLLAKATAGESQVPFFSVSGSEFVEMFVGVGASRVRDLFATARKNAPCIIFIDEIDAVGRARGDRQRFGGNDERESTLNQILTEMDGFNTSEQVVVLAGTNRPDILDKALLRPGRFDRRIHIDRPTMKGRQEIFRVHLANIVTHEDMDYLTGRLAALTPGFAGADIANAVNEAALIAARSNATSVAMIHFEQAIERVVGGLERKSLVLGPEEKKTVAYHEAGHAICGWYFQYADPLLKVSIIPRGQGALGYAQYLPATDAYLMNVRQLMDRMAMTLGGRVSEELHFPTVTTGASDDFKKVTQMASSMVTQWGMSEKLGPLSFNSDRDQLHKPFAESTAQDIDAEVRRIVDEAYKQCRDLLTARKREVGLVAEELLRKEVLTRDDLVRLLGPRPFPEKEEFSKYFDGTQGKKGADGDGADAKTPPPPFPTENTDTPPADGPQPAVFRKL